MRERTKSKKSESWGVSLYVHTSEKVCAASHAFYLFEAHLQKSVLGNGEPGFVLPGTRWDCVIIVHSWSYFFFFFFFNCDSKDIGVSILYLGSWRKTSNIMVWKHNDICFDYSVSQKSAPLWNISQYFVKTEIAFMCNMIAQYIFLQKCSYFGTRCAVAGMF